MSRRKPPRRVLLQCSTRIFQTMFATYQTKKHTLNRLEKSIYEGASRALAMEYLPSTQAKEVIEEFDKELADKRQIAQGARERRAQQKSNGTGEQQSNGTGNATTPTEGNPAA